jgi:hypothetical protein
MGALALGALLLGVSVNAAPRDGAAVGKSQARAEALRTVAGSDAVLRDEVANGATAQGCGILDLRPVPSTRPGACTGDFSGTNTAVLDGNDCAIEIELFVRNTACFGSGVTTFQAFLGPGAPAGLSRPAPLACATNADCTGAGYQPAQPGAGCFMGFCAGATQEGGRTDGWTSPTFAIPACSEANYSCGSVSLDPSGVADNGADHYGATYAYEVDPGTTNATVAVLSLDIDSFFIIASGDPSPIGKVIDATITVPTGRCCTDPCVEGVTRDECGNDALFGPGVLCPQNGGPDCCNCFTNGPDATCADGDACTSDICNGCNCVNNDSPPIAPGTCCNTSNNVRTGNDDGDPCTVDGCSSPPNRGAPTHMPAQDGADCDDDNPCTASDACTGGLCAGDNVNGQACMSDEDCQNGGDTPGAVCVDNLCECSLAVNVSFDVTPGSKEDPNCFAVGEKITIGVALGASAVPLVGGQFYIDYDPSCLDFNSIMPTGVWPLELQEQVDEGAGRIFWAAGVNLGGMGTFGNVNVATLSFTKLGDCSACSLCYINENPLNTRLSDNEGQSVEVEAKCSKEIRQSPTVTIDGPDSVKVNVACNSATATVTWPEVSISSDCEDVELECTGEHVESGLDFTDLADTGGVFPVGNSNFCCSGVNSCGNTAEHCWTVTVNDETCLDVEVQLSPTMVTKPGGGITRCIKFEVFSNCVQPPLVFETDMVFGGLWNLIGHFNGNIKIPSQVQPVCISARDQLHTLRGCYLFGPDDCRADGCLEATFKGDPFFGGNWLIGGNLDGWKKDNPNASHDVIDILDFGQLVSQWLADYGSGDTPCPSEDNAPNADINGDGLVDLLDFSFVSMNFLEDSKDCCCPGSASLGNTQGRTSITVNELKRTGMGDLSVADLNADGVVDLVDMQALMQGVRPQRQAPDRDGKGAGSSRSFNR